MRKLNDISDEEEIRNEIKYKPSDIKGRVNNIWKEEINKFQNKTFANFKSLANSYEK